jgi:hypothetical protein
MVSIRACVSIGLVIISLLVAVPANSETKTNHPQLNPDVGAAVMAIDAYAFGTTLKSASLSGGGLGCMLALSPRATAIVNLTFYINQGSGPAPVGGEARIRFYIGGGERRPEDRRSLDPPPHDEFGRPLPR